MDAEFISPSYQLRLFPRCSTHRFISGLPALSIRTIYFCGLCVFRGQSLSWQMGNLPSYQNKYYQRLQKVVEVLLNHRLHSGPLTSASLLLT